MLRTFTLCGTGPKEVRRTARIVGKCASLSRRKWYNSAHILHRKLPEASGIFALPSRYSFARTTENSAVVVQTLGMQLNAPVSAFTLVLRTVGLLAVRVLRGDLVHHAVGVLNTDAVCAAVLLDERHDCNAS